MEMIHWLTLSDRITKIWVGHEIWNNLVERPIFRNLKITYIKIAKDELVKYFINDFFLLF